MSKRRGFIRALWGKHRSDYGEDEKVLGRRDKMDSDLSKTMNSPVAVPFKMYVFGEKNFEYCKEKGMDCVLMDERPEVFNGYRHKIEVYKRAMEDFDEIVFLDIDCRNRKKVTDEVWDLLAKKGPLQASLMRYTHPRNKKCYTPWRPTNSSYYGAVPNGGFVYMRDKSVVDLIYKVAEEFGSTLQNEEKALVHVADQMMGILDKTPGDPDWPGEVKWPGDSVFEEEYFENFHPYCLMLNPRSPLDKPKFSSVINSGNKERLYFRHYPVGD